MLGFNFLSMENYAPVEGFTSKKEKFTSDELEALMDVDEDTTTTSGSTTTTSGSTTTTMVDDVETEEMETTTTMVDDDEETTTTMVDDNEETTTTMVNDNEETTTTMADDDEDEDEFGDVTAESGFENVGGEEGFVGSSIIRRQATRSTLYLILCIGLIYVAIKLMGVYQKKRMNMVYKKVKFLKLNKLNLDTDLVLSVVVGGLVYLIGMRMGWF
jgi:hypothetical protein